MQKMTPFGTGTAGFIQLVHMTACDRCRTQLEKSSRVTSTTPNKLIALFIVIIGTLSFPTAVRLYVLASLALHAGITVALLGFVFFAVTLPAWRPGL